MTFTNLLFSLPQLFWIWHEVGGNIFTGLCTNTWCLIFLEALHLCVDVSSVALWLSDCLAADLATRKAHVQ